LKVDRLFDWRFRHYDISPLHEPSDLTADHLPVMEGISADGGIVFVLPLFVRFTEANAVMSRTYSDFGCKVRSDTYSFQDSTLDYGGPAVLLKLERYTPGSAVVHLPIVCSLHLYPGLSITELFHLLLEVRIFCKAPREEYVLIGVKHLIILPPVLLLAL
jgi:hypothetical protein